MRPETVARVANNLDPASAAAFDRFTQELGFAPGQSPGETVAAVHQKLGEYSSALDRVTAKEAALRAKKADRPLILGLLEKAARGAVGHVLGGPLGAVVGMLGKGAASTEAELGGALLASKNSLQTRTSELIAKFARGGAKAMRSLAPVTSWLGQSLVTGKRDPEKHLGVQAVNRIDEIHAMNMNAPDQAYVALQGLMGHPGDLAFKMHQQVVGATNHLAVTAPRDPMIDASLAGSNWTPTIQQCTELAYRLEAVHDPHAAITRILAGDGHPAAADTLHTVWPALMANVAQELAFAEPTEHMQSSAVSTLTGVPMTGLSHPAVVTAIQGLYLPKPSPSAPSQRPSNPTGRPAAVQNEVAGSSVSKLLGTN